MRFTIPQELLDLNRYIASMNSNRYRGNSDKRNQTNLCSMYVKRAMRDGLEVKEEDYPLVLTFNWYVKNRRKDPDNVAFAKKFILDGMQEAGLIRNDGYREIWGWEDNFQVDKSNPRVEVEIRKRR